MRGNLRQHWPEGVLIWIVLAAGCNGPTEPPTPPGGGADFALDAAIFRDAVAPVLAQYGCHAMECHGGGIRGTYQLSPPDALDPDFDFEQTRWQVDPYEPLTSPVLGKPLREDAGGAPHAWEPFDSADHAGYRAIRDWILAGEFR